MSYPGAGRGLLVIVVLAACASDPQPPVDTPAPALDLDAVVRQVHFAFRPDGDGFRTDHSTYAVRVDDAGLTFVPSHRGVPAAPFHLAIEGRPRHDAGRLTIDRGGVEERYENREDGVSQTWHFARAPRAFDVRIAVSGLDFDRATDTGLHFVDRASGVGVRYGHATFIDADGDRTHVAARWEDGAIALAIPRAVLGAARYPAVLDPIISPEFGIDNPVAGPAADSQLSPAVAPLGTGHIVVWSDRSDIIATRVDAAGAVLDPYGIVISAAAFEQSAPSIASNGTTALVVWEDNRATGTFMDIWGARIGATGAPIDASGFSISVAMWQQRTPDVAWNGTEWYVVWSDQRGGSQYDIRGTRVSAGGVVADTMGTLVSNATQDQTVPRIASNGVDWFTVWQDKRAGFLQPADVYGTRISAAGVVQSATGVAVSTAARDQLGPSIAASGTDYLVVWQDYRDMTVGSAVWGARVDAMGNVVDASGFAIRSGSGNEVSPVVGSDGTRWLVAYGLWSGSDYDVWAIRVTSSATTPDPAFAVAAAPGAQSALDIAYSGGNYLIVDQDERTSSLAYHDIYGARVRAFDSTVLDPSGIRLTTAANRTAPYDVASNGANYLVVFDDERNGHERDTFAARIGPNGEMRDPAGIAIGTGAGWQQDAAVGSNGDNWLVVFTSHTSSTQPHLYGVIVSAAGVAGPRFTISEGTGSQGSPTIAAIGSDYYVAWRDNHISGTTGIYGSRVSASGVVASPGGTIICEIAGYRYFPEIASNGSSYYLVWRDERTDSQGDVYGTAIDAAGVPAAVCGAPIAVGSWQQSQPQIASDGTSFFAVWSDARAFPARVYGTAISAAGVIATPDGAPLNNTTGSGGFAFASNGLSYLLLWNTTQSAAADIVGTRVYPTSVEDPAGYSMIGDAASWEIGIDAASGIDDRYLLVYSRFIREAPFAAERARGRILEFERTNGARCGIGAECDSTFCADGRCCNSACGGGASDCLACSIAAGASADGVCTTFPNGTACTDGTPCTITDACMTGACVGTGSPCSGATCTPVPPSSFVCGPCPAGTYSSDGTGSTVCMPCNPGQFSNAGATACSTCAAGTFSAAGAASCTPCSGGSFSSSGASSCMMCSAGTFSASGAASCSPCMAGRYSAAGASMCTPCMAGTFSAMGASMCTPCVAGTFSAMGATSCMSCSAGTFSAAGASMCTPCAAGTFASSGASMCSPCAAGTYSAAGAASCTPWSTCGAGQYEARAGSATSDRVCVDCTVCPPGTTEVMACTATSDTVCDGFDAGMPDAGMPDAGMSDAGMSDAGMSDAGMTEVIDAGMDAGAPDEDAGTADDAGAPFDAGMDVMEGGCGCRAAHGGGSLYALLALALLIRRRRLRGGGR